MLSKALVCMTLALPIVTGLTAVLFQLPEGWSSRYQGFSDTFLNYALPVPFDEGYAQIINWPLSFGVIIAISFIFNRTPCFTITLCYLPIYFVFITLILEKNSLYPIVNAITIFIVSTLWYLRTYAANAPEITP